MPANGSGLRVTFLTHYFPPEIGAAQTRLSELATLLTEAGDHVTVVTPFPNYPTGVIHPGYRGKRSMEESMDGVRVLRTWTYATRNRGFFKRILNHLSFSFSAYSALRRMGPTDVFYVQSPPLFVGIAALGMSRIKRVPFVFNVSDIWPQSAIELGALHNPIAIRLAEMLERHIYRRAVFITCATPGIVRRLAEKGVPESKLVLLTNGVDTATFRPESPEGALARQLGLDGHRIFLYAGTHGLSQGLEVVLEAAKLTRNPDVLYVMVGEGAKKDELVDKARQEGIHNVRFLPNQPKSLMPSLLNIAYASIIPLRRLDLFKAALPSKMFESMAVGKPLVVALWGEGAQLVETAGCGLVVEPEDPNAMQKAVETLVADPGLARKMGERGRDYVVRNHDRRQIAARLHDVLAEAAGRKGPTRAAARPDLPGEAGR
jgi:glycosyltransferase involved in cell wall biosynthesis